MAVADWWQQQQTKVILLDLLPNECRRKPQHHREKGLASLWSSARGDLDVPRTWLQVGKRTFSVAVWNNLSTYVQTSETLTVFKRRLKTHLFAVSYINWTVV